MKTHFLLVIQISFYSLFSNILIAQNKTAVSNNDSAAQQSSKLCCNKNIPKRFENGVSKLQHNKANQTTTQSSKAGMVWIPAGRFMMGGDNDQARSDEFPKHPVQLEGFFIDETEVTNAQFSKFVDATGYITTAEKDVNWDDLKKQLPPNTPEPDSEMLKAASLVFVQTNEVVSLNDYSQWWEWKHGANWRHPHGPNSSIEGKENMPVVQVSWEDANAYCKWAGKRLPTEAEWEYAARGGLINNIYSWGNAPVDSGIFHCNYWQGSFPNQNDTTDHYYSAAPVKSYPPNAFGLYDMSGNVWEWCSDLYNNSYYQNCVKQKITTNPKGPETSYDPDEPLVSKRVMRGGSFLCNESYCSGYRNASRMKSSPDTGMEHVGFRCVANK